MKKKPINKPLRGGSLVVDYQFDSPMRSPSKTPEKPARRVVTRPTVKPR